MISADTNKLKPEPTEIKYKIISGSLSYCENKLNELNQDYVLRILQVLPGKLSEGYVDYIVMILVLIPRKKSVEAKAFGFVD